MEELALYILDIAQNSISAKATRVTIHITVDENTLVLTITDDGCGMDEQLVACVQDPFTTSRTTRKVGLGIPLLKESCEIAGGEFEISSQVGKGTEIKAVYSMKSFNRPPIGNLGQTMAVLMCCNAQVNFELVCKCGDAEYIISTQELKQVLGDVPISDPNIGDFIDRDVNEGIATVFEEDII